MTCRGRFGSSASAMETPGERKLMLSGGRVEVESANDVSRGQCCVREKKRNITDARWRQGKVLLLHSNGFPVAALPIQVSGDADQHDHGSPEGLGGPREDCVQRPH